MVAAQAEQLQAGPQHGLQEKQSGASLLPGINQAVGLDLQLQSQGPAAADSSQLGAADKLRYFNWDQRDTARAAMQTLVSALSEDPINSYFTGSSRRQRRFVKDEVKGYLKALPRAANFIATADSKAVALWQLLPAETPHNELWAGWTRILAVSPRKWAQLVRLELHYEKAHEAIAADHGPYYYLSFIGTAPEARGRGLGSKLLQEITSRADREGRWCLLEATSEKSEALYARHGFVTYEAFRVSKKAPPVFLMKRAPAAAAGGSSKALIAATRALSPVFSIKAISVSTEPCAASILLLQQQQQAISVSSTESASSDLVAAVAAKEAAAGSNGSSGDTSLPSSPLIAAAHDSLALAAAAAIGSRAEPSLGPFADAQVIISSGSSNSLAKDALAAVAAVIPAAAPAVAAMERSSSSNGSSQHGESPVEYGVSQDEAGCDSSSPAGAGGPTAAAAAGC